MADRDTEFWNDLAPTYDEGPDHGMRDPSVRAAWLYLLRDHLPDAPSDIVDLGCGTGTLSVLLAHEGHRVRGVDSATRMVQAARAKAQHAGVSALFEHADAADPPYEAASCDVVLVRHVLWALLEPEVAVARWATLLRPGGRFVVIEGTWHTGGGLAVVDVTRLVGLHASSVTVHRLDDPALWGGPLTDERYLVVGTL